MLDVCLDLCFQLFLDSYMHDICCVLQISKKPATQRWTMTTTQLAITLVQNMFATMYR